MGVTKISIGHGQNIKELPNRIYLDPSFLLAAFIKNHPLHQTAAAVLFSIEALKKKGLISTLGLDECWWGVLVVEYSERTNNNPKGAGRYIKKNPHFILKCKNALETFQRYIDQRVRKGKFNLVGVKSTLAARAFNHMLAGSMSPRDSFHLAVLEHENVNAIVTADRDYERSPVDITMFHLNQ